MRHVIIGAGLAGHRAALELRKLSVTDEIVLVGAEPGLPYDRPPLSKDVLVNGAQIPCLKDADRYEALEIDYRSGVRVTDVHTSGQLITTQAGEQLAYDRLLIATGSTVRRLPASVVNDCPVHYLRTAADAKQLNTLLTEKESLLVIGAGFIGLEIAAAAREAGLRVVVIEAGDRPLARALPGRVADYMTKLHADAGVEILVSTQLTGLQKHGALCIADTTAGRFEVDAVVAGIGVSPNTALAERAGLKVRDGIIVDEQCRTSHENVFAAGEVTRHPSSYSNSLCRLEAWNVANKQPYIAAAVMAGGQASYDDPPWFWTDQFGQNLQMIGLPDYAVETRMIGDMSSHQWALIGMAEDGRPVMGVAMNFGRYISRLRREMPKRQPLPDAFFS